MTFGSGVPVVFDSRQKYIVGLWLRVVAAGVFLLLLAPISAVGIDFPWSQCYPAFIGLVALVVANAAYWQIGAVRGFPVNDFYAHWAVDLVLISVILYGLGGALLPSAITAYILIVITSAVFISRNASFLVATGAAVAYGGSLAAEVFDLIDPKYELGMPRLSTGMTVLVIGAPVAMVYLVAFITGTLGDQLNAMNRLLTKRNEELRERNESLDRMRSELEFQSNVLAHDVRSPVSAAYGAVSAFRRELAEGTSGRPEESLLDMALENLNRVEDMIDAVQQAREEMESAEIIESVDLAGVIRELRVELDRHLEQRRIKLEISDPLPNIRASTSRLIVVFRNLIGNAMRYVPTDGTGIIVVGGTETESEWRVFVSDNGGGVKPEFQRVIFEMFRKAPQKQKSPGMGFGLALVRKVAEAYGGRAWVESDGRSGSTFWVSFSKEPINR